MNTKIKAVGPAAEEPHLWGLMFPDNQRVDAHNVFLTKGAAMLKAGEMQMKPEVMPLYLHPSTPDENASAYQNSKIDTALETELLEALRAASEATLYAYRTTQTGHLAERKFATAFAKIEAALAKAEGRTQ